MGNTPTNQSHNRRGEACEERDQQKCRVAEGLSEEAAEHAVKKVFAILGVNIDNPESVEEFRADLRFGKKMRKTADYGTMAFIGIVATGMAAALWAGIVSKINGGNG